MGRDTSKVVNQRTGATTIIMEEGETNSAQKWACSSLSSSDKFSSLYDKVLEGSEDWDQKNVESLVSSQSLQRSTVQPAVAKPRSKIFFPHIMTRGSVVGNKVYCKTSINNCFTWRPRNSLCASSSVLLTNFYLERSSDIQSGIAKIAEEAPSSDPEENEKTEQPRLLSSELCRTLVLTVAGAAGMQLLFPSIRLPLLEVLLFSHQKLPTRRRRSPLFSDRGGGWWHLPLNLALAISRPFYGSVLRRSLTAVLFLVQLRVKDKFKQRSARYMPVLYSVPSLEKPTPADTDLNLPSEFSDNSTDTEVAETLSWESNSSATCSEDGDNSLQAEEDLSNVENDSSQEFPPSLRALQDVISDDGLSSTGENCEQDVISDDGLSSSGDSVDDQDVISDAENSSITSSCLKYSDVDDYNPTQQSILQAYHTAFSQPYDESPVESSPTRTSSSSVFTSETRDSSDISTSSAGSDPYSGLLTLGENSDETNSSSGITTSSSGDLDIVVPTEEDLEETHSHMSISSTLSSAWVGGDTHSVSIREDFLHENHHSVSNISTFRKVGSDPDSVVTMEEGLAESRCISDTSTTSGVIDLNNIFSKEEEEDVKETSSTLHSSTSSTGIDSDSVIIPKEDTEEACSCLNVFPFLAGSDPDSVVTMEEDLAESRCISRTSTTSGVIDVDNFSEEEDVEETYAILHTSTSWAGIDSDSVIILMEDTEEAYSTLNVFPSLAGSDPDSILVSPGEDSAAIVEKQRRLLIQQRDGEFTSAAADTFRADVVYEGQRKVPSTATAGTTSCFLGEQPPPPPPEIVDRAVVENSAAVSPLDDQIFFPFSEEFQFHDDIPPSPCERSRSLPSSSGRLLALFGSADDTQSTPGSSKSVQMSPRADLTALMPEEYGCVPAADGTWEIQVDRDELEVVWTPFKKRPVLVSDGEEDSSNFSDESTADDTDSCKSADGSQTGRDDDEDDDEPSHEDRKTRMVTIAQNAAADTNSVRDRKFHCDCVQIESNKNFGVDISSLNRFSRANLESPRRLEEEDADHAKDERECVPTSITGMTVSDNEDAFEFQSSLRLRERSEAAEVLLGSCEGQGNKVVKAIKLTIPLDGEELFGLKGVIPEHSDRSPEEAASTEISFTRRQDDDDLHGRKYPAAEVVRSEDDCGVVKRVDSGNVSSLRVVVDSVEEFDRVRVPVVARVLEEGIIESQIKRNKSLAVSVSSSSFATAFGDDFDTSSSETPSESTSVSTDSRGESPDASSTNTSSGACGLFTDHPTCLHLRKVRHSHGDQVYLKLPELLSKPWRNLVYWHGRCREGRPTLVVLLGKAVSQLSAPELKHFITVTISHAEYAELNFFKGAVKQLNILMDLGGLGFMRLPPMHVLQSIGTVLNRDYAGRGGWIFLVNAPMMLGLVISAMQRVILRPSYTKGAVIDKGFLEGKERVVTLGGRYKATLLEVRSTENCLWVRDALRVRVPSSVPLHSPSDLCKFVGLNPLLQGKDTFQIV